MGITQSTQSKQNIPYYRRTNRDAEFYDQDDPPLKRKKSSHPIMSNPSFMQPIESLESDKGLLLQKMIHFFLEKMFFPKKKILMK